jgi:PAS domain S-box-containing protein
MKKLKSKITLGVLFLFLVIVLLSIMGIIFTNKLAEETKGTIVNNYTSVGYSFQMSGSIENLHIHQLQQLKTNVLDDTVLVNSVRVEKNIFENKLEEETNNITEPGESELVNQLHSDYREYLDLYREIKSLSNKSEYEINRFNKKYFELRNSISEIYNLNMSAIQKKSSGLQNLADDITIYNVVIAAISILITLSFIFYFPSRIVEPIKRLTESIKSISERNYDQKLEVNSKDELGELANAFNIMAERLKLYETKHIDQLLFEQKRLEAVVHNIEDGLIFLDENRRVVLVNNTILELTGLKKNNILYQIISDAAKKNDLVKEIYKTVIQKHSDFVTEIKPVKIFREGKELFYNIETEEIITYSESGKKETFIGNLILLRNITKYQERDTAKTNLLATASHELKTPLSSINLGLKLLEDKRIGKLNEEQKDVVDSLRQQSNRLSRVINELLDYSQIETGNIRLKISAVKPDLVADIGITALSAQLSEKNIDLQTNIEDNLPDIKVDLEKLAFVFINILNNAIRYSNKEGKIQIDIKQNQNTVEFSIKDNGPGISEDDKEKLFRRFSHLGNQSRHGWGLGLAISKEFIQAQGGKIWVESEVGKGSQFIFVLQSA